MTGAINQTVEDRLLSKVAYQPNGCWEWTGYRKNTYGSLCVNSKDEYTHRLSYEIFRGAIPDGLHIDHLCRNRPCCNPWHLEPVTLLENVRRGDWRKAQREQALCKRGHDLTDSSNLVKSSKFRMCKACDRIRALARTR